MIEALESGGHSASVDHFRQSFSARRSRVEQADPRLRALDLSSRAGRPDRLDRSFRNGPTRSSETERISRFEQSTSIGAVHQSLQQSSGAQGVSLQVQRDQLQFDSRISQFALGGGDTSGIESIASSLSNQPEVIGDVFEVVELLAGFNGDLSGGFLERIQEGLSDLAETVGGGSGLQATRLDLSFSFQSDSVEFSSGDGETLLSQRSQRVEINVRFLSLTADSQAVEPVEAIRAGIGDQQATLEGQGPLAVFDFNGDGQFNFDDFEELAGGFFTS